MSKLYQLSIEIVGLGLTVQHSRARRKQFEPEEDMFVIKPGTVNTVWEEESARQNQTRGYKWCSA